MQTNQRVNLRNGVIYTRVSTLHQAEEGMSLAEQLERCLAKAKLEGITVVATYSDEGESGTLFQSRPGIQSALVALNVGKAKYLVTMCLDRLGNDMEVILEIERRVTRAGGSLVFAAGMPFQQNAIDKPAQTTPSEEVAAEQPVESDGIVVTQTPQNQIEPTMQMCRNFLIVGTAACEELGIPLMKDYER